MNFPMRRGPAARGWLVAALAATALTAPLAACHRAGGDAAQGSFQGSVSSQQADAMLKVLADAPSHGFAPNAFPTAGLADGIRSGDAATRNAAQGRLASEVLAYAKAQHGLSIPKSAMDKNWGMHASASYDPAAEFNAAVTGNRLDAWLAALPPPQPQYELLRRGYLTYLKIANSGGWQPIPAGPDLRPGSRDPRVTALRQRLAFEDASLAQAQPNAAYDPTLGQAVRTFQHRHGLKETGVADAGTIAALNVPAVARAAQIRANLERWRWAPRETPPTRIDVNSVAGLFDMFQDGQPVMHMLVAAGKPGDETPIVASKIHTVVINPTWNVPPEIAANELIPKGQAYLSSHNFTQEGDKLVQQPGPANSLGQVKFLFDNPYSVYLHDTPARAAFAQSQRSVSHGCVRLEHAVDLAKYLLGREAGWTPERVDQEMAGNQTQNISLKQPIPVRIFYWTAFVEGDQVSFRDDIYGWDEATLRALDSAGTRRT